MHRRPALSAVVGDHERQGVPLDVDVVERHEDPAVPKRQPLETGVRVDERRFRWTVLPFSAVTAPAGRRREDAYRPGQRIQVSVIELDKKRRRLSLGLEGDRAAGSKADIHAYSKTQSGTGLNAMAAAFEKLQQQ